MCGVNSPAALAAAEQISGMLAPLHRTGPSTSDIAAKPGGARADDRLRATAYSELSEDIRKVITSRFLGNV